MDIEVAGLVTKLSIDDADLERSMTELNRSMKLVQSEFQKYSSSLIDSGKGTEGLKVKSDALTKQLELQGVRVAKLQQEHQKAVEEKGKDAVATQKLETQLNQAAAQYNKLDGELKATNAELAKQQKEAEIAASGWSKLSVSLNDSSKKLQSVGKEMTAAGKTATMTLTAPIVALGGVATKMAIDFESAFAGVRKTVDASETEFATLSAGIRDMAKEMPKSATEIAKVAEAAGQLGVRNDAILGFTRTMTNMGTATNMSSDQAAMALARLATITGMNQQEFDRLGSTIVHLGNNLAATESEITEMGLRLAGAGATVGMAEHQILAFAGSLAAVGINAEAGGTAVSKLMINIANEVATGGKKLSGFAQVAGMTAGQFQKAFKEDAATAIVAFIEGLGNINKAGGNTFAIIEDLGLSEVRLRDALLRASGAGDVMRNSLELGEKAWRENNALTKEAEERYKTTASQLQIFRNRLTDAGITLGNALIPALLKTLDALQPLVDLIARTAEGFAKLPSGMQTTIIATAGLTAAMGPLLMLSGSLLTSIGTITGTLGKLTGALAAAGGAKAALATATRGLGTALMFLVANPIGLTITAVATLSAGLIALHRVMGKDSIQAVQTFGDASQKAMDKASGSFQKFRGEAEGTLKETATVAKVQGAVIGDNVASGVVKGTGKAKDTAITDMREMFEGMKREVDRNRDSLNKLGDALVSSLKKQYESMERDQTSALDRQLENEKRASDERLKIYDREYTEKLKLIDEETYLAIKALQNHIDSIDKQTDAEEKAAKEQEYQARLTELNKQLAAAETAEEREKIQRDLTKAITDYERQQLLESRKMQKDALKDQIEAIKEAANAQKDQLKQEYEDKKSLEKEQINDLQARLNEEKAVLKEHYAELVANENLQSEARKLIIEGNQEEIVQLLETYTPKWQDAGQNFADAFANGLNSEKLSIADAVRSAIDIAPVINEQVLELDRLQVKLKELEEAAKAVGSGGGGGGLSDIASGFSDITTEADLLAATLNENIQPALKDFAEASEEATDDAVDAFLGLRNKATIELNGLYWSGKEVSEDTAVIIADSFFAMGETIETDLKSSHTKRLKEMEAFFQSSGSLTEEEKRKAIAALTERMEQEAKEVQNGQNRVAEILSKAIDEKRALTEQEYNEITSIQRKMTDEGVRIISGGADEHKAILERLRNEASELTAQQAAEMTKNSIKQRDESVALAEEQYDLAIAQIIKLRDESGVISAEQADKLIQEAKRQRDETVSTAEDMHKKVINSAQAQAWDHINKVDWETGEILTKWEVFRGTMKKTWDGMVDDAKTNLNNKVNAVRNNYISMRIAIDEKMEEIRVKTKSKWAEIESVFKSVDLSFTGKNIMEGLLNGINSMSSEIRRKTQEIADSVKNTIKGALGISSPSKVMMELGEWTGEGLALGLGKTIDDIKRKAKAMAAAATPEMGALEVSGVGAGSTSSNGGTQNAYHFEGMFAGANFSVRDDRDIKELARELGDYILSKGRG